MANRLGVIAGGGGLPRRLIESCRAAERDIFVLAIVGAAEPATVCDVPHAWCRLGAAATGLALLRENDVTELVLAGAVRRPSLAALRPDWRAAKLLARIGYRMLGDDGLLSAVVKELEEEGFRVAESGVRISRDPIFRTGAVYEPIPEETTTAGPLESLVAFLVKTLTESDIRRLRQLLSPSRLRATN